MSVPVLWWILFFSMVALFVVFNVMNDKRARLKEAEEEKANHEKIRRIFLKFEECFHNHGFTFEFAFDKYRGYRGETIPVLSGGYISIRSYSGNEESDCTIESLQIDLGDATRSSKRFARKDIHQGIVGELVHNRRSAHSAYFSRQDLFSLDEIGIEKVVEDLIAFQREYDKIWFMLYVRDVQKNVAVAHSVYRSNLAWAETSIKKAIDDCFPKAKKSEISS